ncbi:MAG: hypothetical protein KC613_03415 [Myxococcales bacterium]|nr:hypothetical protein [Myxococcales bacterium]MCB9525601.1 hypothetical protein [Myxococcales bacterium]
MSRGIPAGLRIVARDTADVTPIEAAQMQALATRCDPYLPSDHIQRAHLQRTPARYYLAFQGERLVGMQSYVTHRALTPFDARPLPVFEGRLTYKDPACAVRGLTARMSFHHVRQTLGPAFLLRTWVAIAHSPNPRVYAQFRSALAEVHPRLTADLPACAPRLVDFVSRITGTPVSPHLVDHGDPHLPPAVDVSETFRPLYATRNPTVDNAYFSLGIFERRGTGVWLTDRALFVVGVHRPLRTLLHHVQRRLRR